MRREFPPLDLGGIAAYVQALKDHDWSHPMCDDHARYQRGHNALENLKTLRKKLDPDFSLWNVHCHPACKNGASYF